VDPVSFVIDAHALVAYVKREVHWERVAHTIDRSAAGTISLKMTAVNAGEAIWSIERVFGASAGHKALESIQIWTDVVTVDLELAARAAWFKLRGGISYADCFAAALAHREGIPVITGDPEFRRVEDVVQIAWLDSLS
jgi:predicted nucleic acid-binding protein